MSYVLRKDAGDDPWIHPFTVSFWMRPYSEGKWFAFDTGKEGDQNRIVRMVRKLVPMTTSYHGKYFFTSEAGRRIATPFKSPAVPTAARRCAFATAPADAFIRVVRDTPETSTA